jgi:hypothetical protein
MVRWSALQLHCIAPAQPIGAEASPSALSPTPRSCLSSQPACTVVGSRFLKSYAPLHNRIEKNQFAIQAAVKDVLRRAVLVRPCKYDTIRGFLIYSGVILS